MSTSLDSLPCDKKATADTAVCEDCNSPKVRCYNANIVRGMYLVCFQEKYVLLGLLYMKMLGLHTTEHNVVCKSSSSYFCREVWWLDLQFHLKAFTTTLCSLYCEQQSSVHSYFTDHASSPRLPFPPLFSLTIPKKNATGTSHKKQAHACSDRVLKNQPNQMGMTPHYYYTIPTSCAILPTMHTELWAGSTERFHVNVR